MTTAPITIDSLEYTNASFLITKLAGILQRMQDEANVIEVYDSLCNHYKFLMDTGATHTALQLGAQGSLGAEKAIHIYRAYMYMHKTNVNTVLNWDFSE